MAKTRYTYKYNGIVCRNSNKLYKYGLVNHEDVVIACSGTKEGALKNKTWRINLENKSLVKCLYDKRYDHAEYHAENLKMLKMWHIVELEVIEN